MAREIFFERSPFVRICTNVVLLLWLIIAGFLVTKGSQIVEKP